MTLPGPLPSTARAPAGLGPIKAAALRDIPRRNHLYQTIRRTLILRALGQRLRGDGLGYENAAGQGCVAAYVISPWYLMRRPMMGLLMFVPPSARPSLRAPSSRGALFFSAPQLCICNRKRPPPCELPSRRLPRCSRQQQASLCGAQPRPP